MDVRLATISDGERLAEIYVVGLARSFVEAQVQDPVPEWRSAWMSILSWDVTTVSRTVLVAEDDDGQIMGFVSFGSMLEMWQGQDVTGEVYRLYVHPDYWRQGVGEVLIDHANERLLAAGHKRCLLWIVDGATGAENFYLSRHWEKTDLTRPDFEGAPIRRRCMTKVLTPSS